MSRRLFHYTAQHHAEGIIRDGGIHGGVIPVPGQDTEGAYLAGHVPGWQWLTSDATWRQPWSVRVHSRCDRAEVRFIVEIPLLSLHRLKQWDKVAATYGYTPDLARQFAEIGGGTDSANWYVFRGEIPADWIVDLEERPGGVSRRGRVRCGRALRAAVAEHAAQQAGGRGT